MRIRLLTSADHANLLANGHRSAREDTFDPYPVVKLFTPDAGATWLLTELDPNDQDRAFGLCDLGLGCPELGYVSILELAALRGRLGLPVERDRFFVADRPISRYAVEAKGKPTIEKTEDRAKIPNVASRKDDVWLEFIDLPPDLPSPVSLHFGDQWVDERVALYLVNDTGNDLLDVTITRSGWMTMFNKIISMNPFERTLDRLPTGTGQLFGSYGVLFDADFMISWRVTGFDASGQMWLGTVDMDKGKMSNAELGLHNWAPVAPTAPAGETA